MGWQATEVLLGTWLGCYVHLQGETEVHRGAWSPMNGTFGKVRTDCGKSGYGYLNGEPEQTCRECHARDSRSATLTD